MVNSSTSGPNLSFFTNAWEVGRASMATDSASCSTVDPPANCFLFMVRFLNVVASALLRDPVRLGSAVLSTHGGLFSVRVASLRRMDNNGTSNAERRTSSAIEDLLRRKASMESASRFKWLFTYSIKTHVRYRAGAKGLVKIFCTTASNFFPSTGLMNTICEQNEKGMIMDTQIHKSKHVYTHTYIPWVAWVVLPWVGPWRIVLPPCVCGRSCLHWRLGRATLPVSFYWHWNNELRLLFLLLVLL